MKYASALVRKSRTNFLNCGCLEPFQGSQNNAFDLESSSLSRCIAQSKIRFLMQDTRENFVGLLCSNRRSREDANGWARSGQGPGSHVISSEVPVVRETQVGSGPPDTALTHSDTAPQTEHCKNERRGQNWSTRHAHSVYTMCSAFFRGGAVAFYGIP